MKTKEYKIERGVYEGKTEECTIRLPLDITLITGGKNDMGNGLMDGHFHYIGIVREDYEKIEEQLSDFPVILTKLCKDLSFLTIHDIKFIGESPNIINPDIMDERTYEYELAKWNNANFLGDYGAESYIAYYDEEFRLIKMSQIRKIISEFNIRISSVHNRSYNGEYDYRAIERDYTSLDGLRLNGFGLYEKQLAGQFVYGNAACSYWKTLIQNTLGTLNSDSGVLAVDFGVYTEYVENVDIAHEAYLAEDYDKLREAILMKKTY